MFHEENKSERSVKAMCKIYEKQEVFAIPFELLISNENQKKSEIGQFLKDSNLKFQLNVL